ncbi:hypothetical protein [Nonomuraea fuscirosea]|uniref:hypothetical protein n=1 Tax=Nonomuraea fuscirosea TaxID=1291556 RepID=UPI0033FEC923
MRHQLRRAHRLPGCETREDAGRHVIGAFRICEDLPGETGEIFSGCPDEYVRWKHKDIQQDAPVLQEERCLTPTGVAVPPPWPRGCSRVRDTARHRWIALLIMAGCAGDQAGQAAQHR